MVRGFLLLLYFLAQGVRESLQALEEKLIPKLEGQPYHGLARSDHLNLSSPPLSEAKEIAQVQFQNVGNAY